MKTATGVEGMSRHYEKGRGVNYNCVETIGITWNCSRQRECMAILGIGDNTVEEGTKVQKAYRKIDLCLFLCQYHTILIGVAL